MKEKKVLITLFGGSGDLAKRKLYPALFRLYKKGHLNHHFAVIGTARREWNNEFYRDIVKSAVASLSDSMEEITQFASHFYYLSHNINDTNEYSKLKDLSQQLDTTYELGGNRIFYLSVAPQHFGIIANHLKTQNLLTENGFNRLIIEKPFGKDLESAIALNNQLGESFKENQIYRIDHYLGKEMIQNINALRYSNILFEAIWNNRYIDNVQITLAENIGVEDRAGYYDTSGALRDMVQNHIFQILSLLTMEPPVSMTAKEIRNEKIKALRSIRLYSEHDVKENFIRAQYGTSNGELAYLEEKDIASNSRTETFVAGKILIDNFRWSGVPFYIRTGKKLSTKDTVIHIQFKPMAINLFKEHDSNQLLPNILTIHIQPEQFMSLNLNVKETGLSNVIVREQMLNQITSEQEKQIPEAYERLLLECLEGNMSNFVHRDEVELSWRFIDIIRNAWDNDTTSTLPTYNTTSMGPTESDLLLEKDGFSWHSCLGKDCNH